MMDDAEYNKLLIEFENWNGEFPRDGESTEKDQWKISLADFIAGWKAFENSLKHIPPDLISIAFDSLLDYLKEWHHFEKDDLDEVSKTFYDSLAKEGICLHKNT